jgi:hypothetical protein
MPIADLARRLGGSCLGVPLLELQLLRMRRYQGQGQARARRWANGHAHHLASSRPSIHKASNDCIRPGLDTLPLVEGSYPAAGERDAGVMFCGCGVAETSLSVNWLLPGNRESST